MLLHGDKELYVNGENTVAEAEADAFASDLLIPEAYVSRLPRGRDLRAIEELAEELEIAPSIVLGRAQRATRDFAWGHGLKRKLELHKDAVGV